jgi:hypothetical protein
MCIFEKMEDSKITIAKFLDANPGTRYVDGKLILPVVSCFDFLFGSADITHMVRDADYGYYYILMKKYGGWMTVYHAVEMKKIIQKDTRVNLCIATPLSKIMVSEGKADEIPIQQEINVERIFENIKIKCATTELFSIYKCNKPYHYTIKKFIDGKNISLHHLFDIKKWKIIECPLLPLWSGGAMWNTESIVGADSKRVDGVLRALMSNDNEMVDRYRSICYNIFVDDAKTNYSEFTDNSTNTILSMWIERVGKCLYCRKKILYDIDEITKNTRCVIMSTLPECKFESNIMIILRTVKDKEKEYEHGGEIIDIHYIDRHIFDFLKWVVEYEIVN